MPACAAQTPNLPTQEDRLQREQGEVELQRAEAEAEVQRILKQQQDLIAQQPAEGARTAKRLQQQWQEQQQLTESARLQLEQDKQEWERQQAERQKELQAQQRKLEAERKRVQQRLQELEEKPLPQSVEMGRKRTSENGTAGAPKPPARAGKPSKPPPAGRKVPQCKGMLGGSSGGHSDLVRGLAFNGNASALVTCSDDKTIK